MNELKRINQGWQHLCALVTILNIELSPVTERIIRLYCDIIVEWVEPVSFTDYELLLGACRWVTAKEACSPFTKSQLYRVAKDKTMRMPKVPAQVIEASARYIQSVLRSR